MYFDIPAYGAPLGRRLIIALYTSICIKSRKIHSSKMFSHEILIVMQVFEWVNWLAYAIGWMDEAGVCFGCSSARSTFRCLDGWIFSFPLVQKQHRKWKEKSTFILSFFGHLARTSHLKSESFHCSSKNKSFFCFTITRWAE